MSVLRPWQAFRVYTPLRRGVVRDWSIGTLLTVCLCGSAWGQATDFADLSLEELTHYDVTTLGRKNSSVFDTAAPADVVSGDEIHRSGAMTLPEALRLATGVQVSRVDSVNYAISVRGFDDATSSKLLVLVDGRSVYNQLFSGTDWGILDMVLDDVNRIEVQRGPAGTLWGANAMNGVINIVSKNAHSTLGPLVSVAAGNELEAGVTVRDGFAITPAAAMRVYAKFQKHGDYGDNATGVDAWNSRLAGTRFDWDRTGGGGLSIIGEYRELRVDTNTVAPTAFPPRYADIIPEQQRERTGDLTAHWIQPVTDDSELSILAALSRGHIEEYGTGERHTTANIDSQITLHPLPRNELITGATFRSTVDHIHNTPYLIYDDPAATTNFYGLFAQDEFSAIPETLSVTAGSKLERNTFTGWEVQPSLRALWHPTPSQSVWSAVSLAARTPSRAERGVHFFAGVIPPSATIPLPIELVANGAPDFSAEHVISYEVGHRYEASRTFSVDTSLFFSHYSDLRGLRPTLLPYDPTLFPPHFVGDLDATNSLGGYTFGGEISARWHPKAPFELSASVAGLRTHLHENSPGSIPDPSVAGLQGSSPPEEYKLHGTWRPFDRWTLDLMGRQTGRLAQSNVPAYTGLDLRLAWMPRPDLEIELVGRDLLKPEHLEIAGSFLSTGAREIARSYFARITYRR